MEKKDIRSLSLKELEHYFISIGEKTFRAKQLWLWLWQKNVVNFNDITSLSKTLREKIEANFSLNKIELSLTQRSSDKTIKNAINLHDGCIIESVLIPTDTRCTVCVSSQVGCAMACTFCATAKLKQRRNLYSYEIIDQVYLAQEQSKLYYNLELTNIVFMGMGEPLMNYENLVSAIELICDDQALAMSWKRITVSTVGIISRIKQLADETRIRTNLAISLHSAIDEKRIQIIPTHKNTSIEELKQSLKYWNDKTGLSVSLEYVVWKGFNDSPEDIKALLKFCNGLYCKVNLIFYNKVDGSDFQPAELSALELYQTALEKAGVICIIRQSRGGDIDAACGQLANKTST